VRKILLLPLLTIALVAGARAQGTRSQSNAEIEKEVLKVEKERARALQDGDIAVLDRIIADDYAYVNVFGQLNTKAIRLATTKSGVSKHETIKEEDIHFHHVDENTVVMTGRMSGVVHYYGVVNSKPREFTNIYIKQGGHWRIVFHQATPIVEQ